MKHELTTETVIEASPQQVWSVLIQLEEWHTWNPFITNCTGAPEVGTQLVNRMEAPGARAMTFRPTVTAVQEQHSFEWLGHLGVPGIFDGRHRFELQETETGTRLVQSEHFSGILVRLMRRNLDSSTRAGFEAMNEALKERVERRCDTTRVALSESQHSGCAGG